MLGFFIMPFHLGKQFDGLGAVGLNVKGKVKLNKFGAAKRSDWKKAYVRLESGQDIDFTVTD